MQTTSQEQNKKLPSAVIEDISNYVNDIVIIETTKSVPVSSSHVDKTNKCFIEIMNL